jgi:hypothetical protein
MSDKYLQTLFEIEIIIRKLVAVLRGRECLLL